MFGINFPINNSRKHQKCLKSFSVTICVKTKRIQINSYDDQTTMSLPWGNEVVAPGQQSLCKREVTLNTEQ